MILVPEDNYDFYIYGLKRGGHHAIINWILQHYESSIYYNNCMFENNNFYFANNSEVFKKGNEPYCIKVLSFEDRPNIDESSIEIVSKKNKPKKNIIILRDAYNNYASRFEKKIYPHKKKWNEIWHNYDDVEIWKKYAKEFIGETNYLNAIKINYNSWFKDIEYRKKISKNFGNFTDKGFLQVLDFGAGSSFDYQNFDNNAQEMKVLERWKKFFNDKHYYEKIIQDKELEELNKKIFNFVLPKKYI
jgi:hypothetical protein